MSKPVGSKVKGRWCEESCGPAGQQLLQFSLVVQNCAMGTFTLCLKQSSLSGYSLHFKSGLTCCLLWILALTKFPKGIHFPLPESTITQSMIGLSLSQENICLMKLTTFLLCSSLYPLGLAYNRCSINFCHMNK